MAEKLTKVCLICFNVVCLMAGAAMLSGGIFLEYSDVGKSVLLTLTSTITSSQLGAIGVTLIALGAIVFLLSLVGCCGAVSESRGLLGLYIFTLSFLFLGQVILTILAFVYGYEDVSAAIEQQLDFYIRSYGNDATEKAIVDTVQQFFQCCGYNGTTDYVFYKPPSINAVSTMIPNVTNTTTFKPNNITTTFGIITPTRSTAKMLTLNTTQIFQESTYQPVYLSGKWPDSCCKSSSGNYVDKDKCHDISLDIDTLGNYLNIEGCTMKIALFVKENLIIIGAVCLAIAVIELIAIVTACSIRHSLD